MPIRTLIVDDEPPARNRVRSLLDKDPDVEIVGECGDGRCAVQHIGELRPDLLFLDVQMPELDGISVVRAFTAEQLPKIVFVTAYDQYALQAFDAHAVDYLLKPFKVQRFEEALKRAKEQISEKAVRTENDRLRNALKRRGGPEPRLVFRTKSRVIVLQPNEVEYILASANYVAVHTNAGVIQLREKISDVDETAPPEFLRIHRSVIVNVNLIKEVVACGAGESVVIMQSGKELPIGRSFRQALDLALQQ
jgi:two-component system, LytTR family, response regulator